MYHLTPLTRYTILSEETAAASIEDAAEKSRKMLEIGAVAAALQVLGRQTHLGTVAVANSCSMVESQDRGDGLVVSGGGGDVPGDGGVVVKRLVGSSSGQATAGEGGIDALQSITTLEIHQAAVAPTAAAVSAMQDAGLQLVRSVSELRSAVESSSQSGLASPASSLPASSHGGYSRVGRGLDEELQVRLVGLGCRVWSDWIRVLWPGFMVRV